MIKIIMGPKGTGKTKQLIDLANHSASRDSGDVVFIDRHNRHIYNLDHNIRFVDTSQFEISDFHMFYGFICGIIAEDFDISHIFIDSIFKIVQNSMDSFEKFLYDIEKISETCNIVFSMTISGDVSEAPEFVKKYIA